MLHPSHGPPTTALSVLRDGSSRDVQPEDLNPLHLVTVTKTSFSLCLLVCKLDIM